MRKHTPWPWVAQRNEGYLATDWRIKPAYPIKGSTMGFAPHAVVKGDARIVSDVEREANARLIAAAPELLDCLEDALCALEVCGRDFDHVMGKARAAIAKATGEQS